MQAERNFRWAHMSKGTFSDIAAQFLHTFLKKHGTESTLNDLTGLGIICRPNHADQWTMDRSSVNQKGTFCRPSTLQTRLCADYIVNNFVSFFISYHYIFINR